MTIEDDEPDSTDEDKAALSQGDTGTGRDVVVAYPTLKQDAASSLSKLNTLPSSEVWYDVEAGFFVEEPQDGLFSPPISDHTPWRPHYQIDLNANKANTQGMSEDPIASAAATALSSLSPPYFHSHKNLQQPPSLIKTICSRLWIDEY